MNLAVAILPVLLFLGGLALLDSYKLVTGRRLLAMIAAGGGAALVSWPVNTAALAWPGWEQLGGPAFEELAKAAGLIVLIRCSRVGFTVDAGICGFAAGAGFALVENFVYTRMLSGEPLALWILRGVGTAVMHGGTTALAGILFVQVATIRNSRTWRVFVPGLALAIAIHAFFNLGWLTPVTAACWMLAGIPVLLSLVFLQSERTLHRWLGDKLDKDIELLALIESGNFGESRPAQYLHSLRSAFPAETVGDLLALLHLSAELSARAKGDLLRREAGLDPLPDPDLGSRLKELAFLEQSAGRAGLMALGPLLSRSARDLWELRRIRES